MIRFLFAALLAVLAQSVGAQQATPSPYRQVGSKLHYGLHAPNQISPATGHVPLGIELNYSWLNRSQRAWEQCNCVAKVGLYANYITFRNPVALGRTAGAGLFFEPQIRYQHRLSFGIRAQLGLTYLTRLYDERTNPTNRYFSMPVSSMIGLSTQSYYRLTDHLTLNLAAHYNHISNAGTRQPNQGMNLPSLSAGLLFAPQRLSSPIRAAYTPAPLTRRWLARALLMTSVRVLPETATKPEMALPLYGLKLLGGYRLTHNHALSGGVELVDDRYFGEQIKRWNYADQEHQQATLLAGYEYWQGRFALTAHMGWNVVRPGNYKPATYQKYGLLYRIPAGLTLGFDVKAYGEDTKGFQALVGWTL